MPYEEKESLGFLGYRYHSSKHLLRPITVDGSPSEIIGGKNMYHHLLTMKTFPGFEDLFSDYIIEFTSGGVHQIIATDTLTGATSGATMVVQSVFLDSGTWAGGDAAGYLFVNTISGTFEAENLNEGANPNVCTIAAAPRQAQLGSATKRRCVGAWQYIDGNGDIALILAYPDRIYAYYPGDTSPTEITGSAITLSGTITDYFDASYWVDTSTGYDPWIVFSNGVDAPFYWDGTGDCALLGGSPPIGKYVSSFSGHLFISNVVSGGTDYVQRDSRSDVDDAETWGGGFAGTNDLRQSDGAITGSVSFGDLRFVFKEKNATICRATGYEPPLLYEQDEIPIGCIAPKTLIKVWRHDYAFFMGNDLNFYVVAKDGSYKAVGDNVKDRLRDWTNDSKLRYSFAVYFPGIDHVLVGLPSTEHATDFCDKFLAFDLGYFLKTGQAVWSTPIELGVNMSAGSILRFRQAYKIGDLGVVSSDGTIGGLSGYQIKDFFSDSAFSQLVLADNNGYVYRVNESIDTFDGTAIEWELHTKDLHIFSPRGDRQRLQEYELDYEDPRNANATCTVYVSTDGGGTFPDSSSLSLSGTSLADDEELTDIGYFDINDVKFRMKIAGTYPVEIQGQRWLGTNEGRR
jgi:hypothetical protein